MRFSPEYVRLVLNENFEDAKAQFLVAADGDQLRAPGDAGGAADRRRATKPHAIRAALDADRRSTRSARSHYDGTYEDLFFYLERLVVAGCGEDAAGRLHTARSRNDIDMTMYRMRAAAS